MNLKERLHLEKEKLKPMTAKEKLEYIWEYYKIWMIGTILVVIFLYSIISAQIQNSKPTYISATFLNVVATDSDSEGVMKGFVKYANINTKKENTVMDVSIRIDPNGTDEYSVNSAMKLVAQFASKSIDVTVMDPDNFKVYAKQDAFSELDKMLPSDLYEKYKDNIVTAQHEDGTSYICGIDLSNSTLIKNSKLYSDSVKPIFSIISNTENLDHAIQFLEYLYSENK